MTLSTSTVDRRELLVEANDTLQRVVDQIDVQRLDDVLPESIGYYQGRPFRSLINIFAYENQCVAPMLAGATDILPNPEFEGDLLGDDPLGQTRRYTAEANAAARTHEDLESPAHMSYGTASASDYLRDISIYRGIVAIDVARYIGVQTDHSPELVDALIAEITPIAPMLRAWGVFPPEVSVPDDAEPFLKLLGLTGRAWDQ